jgi:hypothetical protein
MYAVFHQGSRVLVTPIYDILHIKEEDSAIGWIDMTSLPVSVNPASIEYEWERYLEWVYYFSPTGTRCTTPSFKEPQYDIQDICGVFPQGLPRLRELFPYLKLWDDREIVEKKPPVALPPEVWNKTPFNAATAWEATRIASMGG